MHECVVVKIWG